MTKPVRKVQYTLTAADAVAANTQAAVGANAGDVQTMEIVTLHPDNTVDGKVLFDGGFALMVNGVPREISCESVEGKWHWPV